MLATLLPLPSLTTLSIVRCLFLEPVPDPEDPKEALASGRTHVSL